MMVGFELEGWLVDDSGIPLAESEALLKSCDHTMIVPELSVYNFELNSTPLELSAGVLSKLHSELSLLWQYCQSKAEGLNGSVLAIGIPPTLRHEMLNLDSISHLNRYYALNEQLLRLRENKPIHIAIAEKKI